MFPSMPPKASALPDKSLTNIFAQRGHHHHLGEHQHLKDTVQNVVPNVDIFKIIKIEFSHLLAEIWS